MAVITKMGGRVVVEAETADSAREKTDRKGYIVLEVNRDAHAWSEGKIRDYKIWNVYHNKYWSTLYLIDKKGDIRYTHIDEGAYDEIDRTIAQLLAEPNYRRELGSQTSLGPLGSRRERSQSDRARGVAAAAVRPQAMSRFIASYCSLVISPEA